VARRHLEQNVLAYGEFPDIANDDSNKSLMMPRGRLLNGNLKEIVPVDLKDVNAIQEFALPHSWTSTYAERIRRPAPRSTGVTDPNFVAREEHQGTRPTSRTSTSRRKYSWVRRRASRASRWKWARSRRYVVRLRAWASRSSRSPSTWCSRSWTFRSARCSRRSGAPPRAAWRARGGAQMNQVLLRQADRQHQGGQTGPQTSTTGAEDLAGGMQRASATAGAARRARALDRDQERQDRQLPVHRADTWNAARATARARSAPRGCAQNMPMANRTSRWRFCAHPQLRPCLACATHVISREGQQIATCKVR